ncbi:MAG: hypothetical protein IKL09_06515 [Clostridia bacterium]|nr:hypothetical protein [Clostridia bacterium]
MSKKVKFMVECEMEERWKDYFLSFLKTMEFFGQAGHSELLGFYSDGDGDFRPKFNIKDTEYTPKESVVSKKTTVNFFDAG